MAIKPSDQYNLSYNDKSLWERGDLSLKGIKAAWQTRRDPRTAEYIVKLVQLDPALSKEDQKIQQGKFNYSQLADALRPYQFWCALYTRCSDLGISMYPGEMKREEIRTVIAKMHKDLWIQVEAHPEAMPDRLKLAGLLLEMWSTHDAFTRNTLLNVMAECPLKYGPWKAMKQIFKDSIERQDWVMFGTIAARLDREGDRLSTQVYHSTPTEPFNVPWRHDNRDVSKRTIRYLLRRAWRALRELAQDQPNLYLEAIAEVLKHYRASDSTWNLSNAWLRNHILFHERKSYTAETFYVYARAPYYGKQAYPELWKESADTLLRLFESAQNELVINFVVEALIADFKAEVEALSVSWINKIAEQKSYHKDAFLYKWFSELCLHPQHDYQQQGLHEALLNLLWSSHGQLAEYALNYFKAHPPALITLLTIDQSMALVRSSNPKLKALGETLLDPAAGHFTLNLDQWTDLLSDENSFKFASQHFVNVFSGKDLNYTWFSDLINHELNQVSDWAIKLLDDDSFKPASGDLFSFYWSLLTPSTWRSKSAQAAFDGLSKESDGERLLNRLSPAQLRALLLHPDGYGLKKVSAWIQESWLSPKILDVNWLKAMLKDSEFEGALSYLEDEALEWREELSHNSNLAQKCESWLLNTAYFTSVDLGANWLFECAFKDDHSWNSSSYQTYVRHHLPLAAFKALSSSLDQISEKTSSQEGFQTLLDTILTNDEMLEKARFLRRTFKHRIEAFRKANDPNAEPLAKTLTITPDLLSFQVYTRLAQSKDETTRRLALDLGQHFYRHWTDSESLSFDDLLPFFEKGYTEVQDHLLKAMSASPLSAEARIDVREKQFDPDGLYAFCFSAKASIRDLGLSLIGEHPDRFANPQKISLLVESSDRRVCEGVVKLLWEKLRFKAVSAPWAPYAQSVSPRSQVAKRQEEVVAVKPPIGKKVSEIKGRRYLGEGTKVSESLPSHSLTWVAEFLGRTLFRLSPTHPLKGDLGRLSAATPAWRNKVNLIKAIRDLAVTDHEFAELVKPILEEFMSSRGQSERAACLVALTRMRAAHPQLFAANV